MDCSRAEAFLAGRFGVDAGEVAPLGSGVWSQAFTFRRLERDYVIRFGAHLEDFLKDRVAAHYAGTALPIPQVIDVGEASGGYYAISERLFGGYIDDLDAVQVRAVLPSLFAALDAARLADLSGTAGYGMWGADGQAPHPSWRVALLDVADDRPADRTHGWRERLAASPVGLGPFEEAYARLVAFAGRAPEERCLIHGDLLHHNVLVDGGRVTAVLDWGCAMYGDPVYDLAWLCFWQPWYPAWKGIDFQAEARRHYESTGLEVRHFEERLRVCQIHIGLEGQAYQAYAGDWANLELTARRTAEAAW